MKTKLQKLQEEHIQLIEELKGLFTDIFSPNKRKAEKAQKRNKKINERLDELDILIKYYSRNTK